jgi:hypothetical protein
MYHGSDQELAVIEPRYSKLTGQNTVFATNNKLHALIFSSKFTDSDFTMGHYADEPIQLEEQYPGAFALLDCTSYIHTIMNHDFIPLVGGLSSEFISYETTQIINVELYNVMTELNKAVSNGDLILVHK